MVVEIRIEKGAYEDGRSKGGDDMNEGRVKASEVG